MPTPLRQRELAMDHAPALEPRMRALFATRWQRWHPARSYEEAVQDPVTHRLLLLAVQHMREPPDRRARK